MAAAPERMKVSPAIPMNSASSRRSRWSGLVQSAKLRCPPTDAISAALPTGSGSRAGWAAFRSGALMSGFPRRRQVRRAAARERERVDDAVEEFLCDAVGKGGLLQGQVLGDGLVGNDRGLVVSDDR